MKKTFIIFILLFSIVIAQSLKVDINNDNKVDILDLIIVVRDFGKTA
jgi:hypothetical protein